MTIRITNIVISQIRSLRQWPDVLQLQPMPGLLVPGGTSVNDYGDDDDDGDDTGDHDHW